MECLRLDGKRLVLGVTGSIAAYKAVGLLRTLVQRGADVSVVMTKSAARFVTPLTFEVLSRHTVAMDIFSRQARIPHLTLIQEADAVAIAPCTANSLARYALGLADDLLSTMLLTTECPVILAPAMDGNMWYHPTVVSNVKVLRERGMTVLDPEEGALASGKWGLGRMPEEEVIVSAIAERLNPERVWRGHRFLISAGPTREPIDAVRFISNGSSGKMGYALAQAAVEKGAEVVLVSGPTNLDPPKGVEIVPVVTAEEMYHALVSRFDWSTVLIMAAAVGDFRPRQVASTKLKKRDWTGDPLELERTQDILAALSAQRTHQVLVGFAAETNDLIQNGQDKLKKKSLDMIVVNQVGGKNSAFGSETNEGFLMSKEGAIHQLPKMTKRVLADRILEALRHYLLQSLNTTGPSAQVYQK